MNMKDAIVTVLQNYSQLQGRASRSEFWWFVLFYMLAQAALTIIDPTLIAASLVSLALLTPMVAVGVRRLHDIDKSGWFLLLGILPVINLYLLFLHASKGTPAPNRYGPETVNPAVTVL